MIKRIRKCRYTGEETMFIIIMFILGIYGIRSGDIVSSVIGCLVMTFFIMPFIGMIVGVFIDMVLWLIRLLKGD